MKTKKQKTEIWFSASFILQFLLLIPLAAV